MEVLNNTTSHEGSFLVFSWSDYTIFTAMLIMSTLVGIYFGIIKKQDTTEKYLLGGKQMGVIPVSISLLSSHLSGITLLAIPSEIYYYGTAYWITIISGCIVCLVMIKVFLPVFYKMQLTSSFEYLEMRFDHKTRILGSFLFLLKTVLYVPIVIYIPAMALSQVTGISVHMVTPLICTVCIFYTTVGGLKAVVWTDTLQFMVTLAAMLLVVSLGTYYAGGPGIIWKNADQGGRIDFFNFDPDLTSRCTFWGVFIGLTTLWISELGVNQGCIQKFLSVPTYADAKKCVIYLCIGILAFKSLCCFSGLLMYTKYQFCDPYTSGVIKQYDQLLPHYVMDVAGSLEGLPGLFIAGVFSTGLSTMSASLNTLSGSLYKDFISPFMPKKTTERTASNIMKLCTVIVGIIGVVLVFVVERLGAIIQLNIAISGITAGPMLGLFTLGIVIPWANKFGAFYGSMLGLGMAMWTSFGHQYHKTIGDIHYPKLPLLTNNCTGHMDPNYEFPTTFDREATFENDVFFLFKMSYMFCGIFGFLVTVISGMVISYCTGFENLKEINTELISPIMQFALPPKEISEKEMKEYKSVEVALKVIENHQ